MTSVKKLKEILRKAKTKGKATVPGQYAVKIKHKIENMLGTDANRPAAGTAPGTGSETAPHAVYDVGIFGWWYNYNYGANLTYFALNRALRNMGRSVIMLWRSVPDASEPDTVQMKFARRYYQNISERLPKEQLGKYNDVCEAFILGSDQIWNPALERFTGDEFFLSFADEDKIKLAYAQSFGNPKLLSKDFVRRYSPWVNALTKVSIREDYGVETFEKGFGLEADQVCDPVFLVERKQYDELIANADIELPDHYVLDFFLNPNAEKVAISQHIRKDIGISNYLNFTDLDHPERLIEAFQGEKVEANSMIENLVKAYQNADFVVTDSFHGTCMAIIFNKPFISIANVIRGDGRFKSILSWAGLSDRLIYNELDLGKKHLQPVDFTHTNEVIAAAREAGNEWIREGLERSKRNTIDAVLKKKMCTGCAACLSACPKGAISLKPDAWGYYRSSIDYKKCIECGKCVRVCPAVNPIRNENFQEPECYEFVSSSDETLQRSTSGGIFPTLARTVLAAGGAVVGAAWKDDFTVQHIIIESEAELSKLQKSKYFQSFTGDIMIRTKKLLESGRQVLFTGTPCQVTGLRAFLGKDYDNLLAVDILCGNAPSAMFFRKYCEENYPQGLSSYEFRYKSEKVGWSASQIKAVTLDGETVIHSGGRDDDYQRVYHKHVMCSPHCEICGYQAFPRVGDLSIGDFWGIGKYDPDLDTSKGVSMVLCNNSKGKKFFMDLPESTFRVRKQVPLEWMGGNGCSRNGGHNWKAPQRDAFYGAVISRPFKEAVNFALKPNHGEFRSAYTGTNSPLQFDYKMLHFRFEKEYWNETAENGMVTLHVNDGKWNETGHYARLSMAAMLKPDRKYRISAKFKVRSASDTLNFHIIDSGSRQFQLVHSQRINDRNDGRRWIEFSKEFTPNTDYYDEVMFGSSQLSGSDNFLTIAYISISEA